jgi:hypothetical protein
MRNLSTKDQITELVKRVDIAFGRCEQDGSKHVTGVPVIHLLDGQLYIGSDANAQTLKIPMDYPAAGLPYVDLTIAEGKVLRLYLLNGRTMADYHLSVVFGEAAAVTVDTEAKTIVITVVEDTTTVAALRTLILADATAKTLLAPRLVSCVNGDVFAAEQAATDLTVGTPESLACLLDVGGMRLPVYEVTTSALILYVPAYAVAETNPVWVWKSRIAAASKGGCLVANLEQLGRKRSFGVLYVTALGSQTGGDVLESVISFIDELPAEPDEGDRYVLTTDDHIYTFINELWDEYTPDIGDLVQVETGDDAGKYFSWSREAWVDFSTIVSHNILSGLQGGTAGEYYHLESAEHEGLVAGGVTTLHQHNADDVVYDPEESGLAAEEVQAAIDEVVGRLVTQEAKDVQPAEIGVAATDTDGAGACAVTDPGHDHGAATGAGASHSHTLTGPSGAGAAHTHTFTNPTGAAVAHTHGVSGNTDAGGTGATGAGGTGSTGAGSAHTHSVTGNTDAGGTGATGAGGTGDTGAGTSHGHAISGATAADGAVATGAGGTGATGAGSSHTHGLSGALAADGTGASGSAGAQTTTPQVVNIGLIAAKGGLPAFHAPLVGAEVPFDVSAGFAAGLFPGRGCEVTASGAYDGGDLTISYIDAFGTARQVVMTPTPGGTVVVHRAIREMTRVQSASNVTLGETIALAPGDGFGAVPGLTTQENVVSTVGYDAVTQVDATTGYALPTTAPDGAKYFTTLGLLATAAAHTHTGPSHTHGLGTLAVDAEAAHTHAGPSHTHTGGSHTHAAGTLAGDGEAAHTHAGPSHTHTGPSHQHGVSLTTGSEDAHTHAGPSHTHTGPSHTHGVSLTSGEGGGHDHTIPNADNEAAHTHALPASTNGEAAHTHAVASGQTGVTANRGAHAHGLTDPGHDHAFAAP